MARMLLKRGPHFLAWCLKLARSTLYAVLRRYGVSRLRSHEREPVVRYEWPNPGALAHLDIKKLGGLNQVANTVRSDGAGECTSRDEAGTTSTCGGAGSSGHGFAAVSVSERKRQAAMPKNGPKDIPAGPLLPDKCRSLARKCEAASRLLRGGEPVGAVPRESGVEICHLEKWRGSASVGMDPGLRAYLSPSGRRQEWYAQRGWKAAA